MELIEIITNVSNVKVVVVLVMMVKHVQHVLLNRYYTMDHVKVIVLKDIMLMINNYVYNVILLVNHVRVD